MKLVFMGTPEFAVPTLEALADAGHDVCSVVTQPDRPRGRGRAALPSPVKAAALARALPLFQPKDINAPDAVAHLRTLEPDAIVVVAFGQKLRREVLGLPTHGCINVHASLLPKYRGAAPIVAALLAGDAETGVTVMQMVEAMDAGDILAQERTRIEPTENAGQLHDRLAALSARTLVDTLDALTRGQLTAQPQDPAAVSVAPKLSKADGVVDWSRDAEFLARFVRAMTPWPGATTHLRTAQRGRAVRMLLLEAAAATAGAPAGVAPGEVVRVTQAGIEAATGRGTLCVTRVQQSGKRPLAAAEFVRGQPVQPGDRFGAHEQQ